MGARRRYLTDLLSLRATRAGSLSLLVAALLVVLAPAIEAVLCPCNGVHESDAPASSCCSEPATPHHDDDEHAADPERSDHPCSTPGDSCCCSSTAQVAIPVDADTGIRAPSLTFAPMEFRPAWIPSKSATPIRHTGRLRCRDSPDLFVLSSLRL